MRKNDDFNVGNVLLQNRMFVEVKYGIQCTQPENICLHGVGTGRYDCKAGYQFNLIPNNNICCLILGRKASEFKPVQLETNHTVILPLWRVVSVPTIINQQKSSLGIDLVQTVPGQSLSLKSTSFCTRHYVYLLNILF